MFTRSANPRNMTQDTPRVCGHGAHDVAGTRGHVVTGHRQHYTSYVVTYTVSGPQWPGTGSVRVGRNVLKLIIQNLQNCALKQCREFMLKLTDKVNKKAFGNFNF